MMTLSRPIRYPIYVLAFILVLLTAIVCSVDAVPDEVVQEWREFKLHY